jgi:phosphopantetheinyl transferase
MNNAVCEDSLYGATCTADELDRLRQLPHEEACRLFWELWTAKEAYLKNIGHGLGQDPRTVDFNVDTVSGTKNELLLKSDPYGRWRFIRIDVKNGYVCTLAVRTNKCVRHRTWTFEGYCNRNVYSKETVIQEDGKNKQGGPADA